MYRSEWVHVLIGRLWSSDGCTTLRNRGDNSVTCHCTHLTSFAVLIQFTEHHTDDETFEGKALTLISQIGCAVSLFCLITTFSVFIYLEYVCPTFYNFILLELDQSEIRAFAKLDSCNSLLGISKVLHSLCFVKDVASFWWWKHLANCLSQFSLFLLRWMML